MIRQVFEENGCHRLIDTQTGEISELKPYQGIASIVLEKDQEGGVIVIGTTDYFEGTPIHGLHLITSYPDLSDLDVGDDG